MSYLLKWSKPLYHGSARLYKIQCYIEKTRDLFKDYLNNISKIKYFNNNNYIAI